MVEHRSPKPTVACSNRVSSAKTHLKRQSGAFFICFLYPHFVYHTEVIAVFAKHRRYTLVYKLLCLYGCAARKLYRIQKAVYLFAGQSETFVRLYELYK